MRFNHLKMISSFFILATVSSSAIASPHQTAVVFVKTISQTKIFDSLDYPARIEAKINALILAESDGVVSKIIKPLGTVVRKSDKLVIIQNTDPVYQYAPMAIENVVSGVVSQVFVTEGSRVAKGDRLMLVTDPAQLKVIVEIPASDLNLLHRGDEAELTQDHHTWKAKIKGMSPFVDPSTGTANCELEFVKNQSEKTRPPAGALVRLDFKAGARNGYSISDSAVFYRGKDTFVRVVRNKHAFLQAIKIGKKQFGSVEVISGLKDRDQVVERASGFISDGEEVKVEGDEPETKKAPPAQPAGETAKKV